MTGTDTDVGKSVACAWALLHLNGAYWKPVQSGLEPPTDTQAVQRLTAFDEDRFFPSRYELNEPLSPHAAAKIDGVRIDLNDFSLPESSHPLIVEGAGGVMVPLNEQNFMIDLMARLKLPVIITARSTLGTINHTLMSISLLRLSGVSIAGVILNGPLNEGNRQAITEYGNVKILGEIPHLEDLSKDNLLAIKPSIPVNEWGQK
jgi:dethiobiotin synthetase